MEIEDPSEEAGSFSIFSFWLAFAGVAAHCRSEARCSGDSTNRRGIYSELGSNEGNSEWSFARLRLIRLTSRGKKSSGLKMYKSLPCVYKTK